MRIAAVQLDARMADVAENLRRCERLADEAAAGGADWIILPEFFTTGIAFTEELTRAALPPDGAGTELLRRLATRHHATVGGSFICRDPDGHNRNAFFLVGPGGEILGRHDKDLPTMWESCFYVGGDDDGVIQAGDLSVGAAMCWEFMRTQTPRRLRGRVDLVVGGSGWWSIPPWPPKALSVELERRNARNAAGIAPAMARLLGVPVAHAAHCGTVDCRLPLTPLRYRGHFQGGTVICAADGTELARRERAEGPGVVVAEIDPVRTAPSDEVPDGFWLHKRGVVPTVLWNYQNAHGRRWYRRHSFGTPVARVTAPEAR